MRKIILLHGIGNPKEGWTQRVEAHRLLGVAPERVIEFYYDDIFQGHWLYRLTAPFLKVPAPETMPLNVPYYVQEYGGDVLKYFMPLGARSKILNRLERLVHRYPDAILMGYSLGSIVAYEYTQRLGEFPVQPALVTLGSPLGSRFLAPLVKSRLKIQGGARPAVDSWQNIYGALDPLSGHIRGLGCRDEDQVKIATSHILEDYLIAASRYVPLD